MNFNHGKAYIYTKHVAGHFLLLVWRLKAI